jgi:hypothetical protein
LATNPTKPKQKINKNFSIYAPDRDLDDIISPPNLSNFMGFNYFHKLDVVILLYPNI